MCVRHVMGKGNISWASSLNAILDQMEMFPDSIFAAENLFFISSLESYKAGRSVSVFFGAAVPQIDPHDSFTSFLVPTK